MYLCPSSVSARRIVYFIMEAGGDLFPRWLWAEESEAVNQLMREGSRFQAEEVGRHWL